MKMRWLALASLIAASGCHLVASSSDDDSPGEDTPGGDPDDAVTYHRDVAPILYRHCVTCHVDGGIAPFPLLSYGDAAAVGGLMQYATAMRMMPPFPVDNTGACNTYRDARWLGDDEIATIGRWVEGGMVEGEPPASPPVAPVVGGLDRITGTIDIGATYTPNASLSDEYRCFVLDPPSVTDTFVTAYHVRPGDPRMVHHVVLFALDTDAAESAAEARDAGEAGSGYTCFGAAGVPSRTVGAWAPGGGPTLHPAGSGIRLTGGRKVVMQVHYNMANGVFPDRTAIDLTLDDQVGDEARIAGMFTTDIALAPRQSAVVVEADDSLGGGTGTVRVWGVFPHMHTRGTALRLDAMDTGACLVDVPRWNFHWQSLYFFDQPLTVSADELMHIRCEYDTSADSQPIGWGEGTDDEMCGAGLYVTR